jgi:hypothetical protein
MGISGDGTCGDLLMPLYKAGLVPTSGNGQDVDIQQLVFFKPR